MLEAHCSLMSQAVTNACILGFSQGGTEQIRHLWVNFKQCYHSAFPEKASVHIATFQKGRRHLLKL
jgi:hypothetical protein